MKKVLDTPSLQDDFYLNLVDWSSQNILAVGLGTCVYLWSASNNKVSMRVSSDLIGKLVGHKSEVCGLKWSCDDRELASGEHIAAVKAIAWSPHQSNHPVSGGGTADRCIRFWNTTTLLTLEARFVTLLGVKMWMT
ncbi:protein fizzy-related 3-like [Trifolium pratense]|uniref:Protein fizzy-related 3-like n=1 Tax=Trifolium pratense TaxID=57577 RepID=A0A2K3LYQ0_TRIPR|nr:protein fizzy-related 3-like [Trifolium pratense]